jgi:hypothetical protein
MKTLVSVLLFLSTALSVRAQAVFLEVELVGSPMQDTRQATDDASEKTIHRSKNIQIMLRNMDTKPCSLVVSWQFLAKSVEDGSAKAYDKGSKKVPLKAGQSTVFKVDSKEVQDVRTHYADGSYSHTGDKTTGYLVLVKAGKKIVAVDASDALLKKQYQDQIDADRLKPKK